MLVAALCVGGWYWAVASRTPARLAPTAAAVTAAVMPGTPPCDGTPRTQTAALAYAGAVVPVFAIWLAVFFRGVEPWLRSQVGRALGVTIVFKRWRRWGDINRPKRYLYAVEGCGPALDLAISAGMTLAFSLATFLLPITLILGGYLYAIAGCWPF